MRKFHRGLLISFVILLFLAAVTAAKKKTAKKIDTSKYASLCKNKPRLTSKRKHAVLQELMQISGERVVVIPESAQHQAACWILHDDAVTAKPGSKRLYQRYALAVLYFNTGGKHWKESNNWLSKKNECKWMGVMCNFRNTIVDLDLGFNNIEGMLPREMSLLKNLVEIDFHGNEVQGVLPLKCLEEWSRLKVLNLSMNGFFGKLPKEIGNLRSLRELHLYGNYFQGPLPTQLASLSHLEKLDVYANNFYGTIPSVLGNLKKLREMDVHDNDLTGSMPREICQLRLTLLQADCLALQGHYPEVRCDCCTICCAGLPHMKCVDTQTKKEIKLDMEKKSKKQKLNKKR